jgi:hypothetical protein
MFSILNPNILNTPIIPSKTNFFDVAVKQPIAQHLYDCSDVIVSPIIVKLTGDCGCGYGKNANIIGIIRFA